MFISGEEGKIGRGQAASTVNGGSSGLTAHILVLDSSAFRRGVTSDRCPAIHGGESRSEEIAHASRTHRGATSDESIVHVIRGSATGNIA